MPPEAASDAPQTIAIAGTSGLVGTAVREELAGPHRFLALTRSPVRAKVHADTPHVTWRHCDLFDPYDVKQALEGADRALYLVHSMLPSSRMTQGRTADLDLLLADNFARAAEAAGVQHILTIGGLVPDAHTLPRALQHRLDIERTLASGRVPVTTLRAGLIVGPGGTWLELMLNLVRRLPVMILPAWTQARTQPIALPDVVRALNRLLNQPAPTQNQVFDIGGPTVMTYRSLLKRSARVLDLKRPMATVPIDAPQLSKLWVRVFSGAPWALVSPLIDSLRLGATVRDNPLQRWLVRDAESYERALQRCVDAQGRPVPNPRADLRARDDAAIEAQSRARSVQRLPLPPGYTAHDVANAYVRWLPRFGWPFLRCTVTKGRVCRFFLRPLPTPILTLEFDPARSPSGRQLFEVTGGLLAAPAAKRRGRLEFRRALDGSCVIAAVHDFAPRLPWTLYTSTQALVHLLVMRRFGAHLQRLAQRERTDAPAHQHA